MSMSTSGDSSVIRLMISEGEELRLADSAVQMEAVLIVPLRDVGSDEMRQTQNVIKKLFHYA